LAAPGSAEGAGPAHYPDACRPIETFARLEQARVSYAVTPFCSGPSVVHFWKHCPASACRYMSSRPRTARRCPVCAEVAYATAPLAAQGHRRAAAALAAQHRRAALLCAGFEGWHAAVAEPRRRALAAWAHARYAAAFAAWCRCSPRSQLPAANSFAPVLSYLQALHCTLLPAALDLPLALAATATRRQSPQVHIPGICRVHAAVDCTRWAFVASKAAAPATGGVCRHMHAAQWRSHCAGRMHETAAARWPPPPAAVMS